MLWRWLQAKESLDDPNYAPLRVFDLIGYAETVTSGQEAIPKKFLLERDKVIINKDRLLHESGKLLEEIKVEYEAPTKATFKLPGQEVRDIMYEKLENLYKEKRILDHSLSWKTISVCIKWRKNNY